MTRSPSPATGPTVAPAVTQPTQALMPQVVAGSVPPAQTPVVATAPATTPAAPVANAAATVQAGSQPAPADARPALTRRRRSVTGWLQVAVGVVGIIVTFLLAGINSGPRFVLIKLRDASGQVVPGVWLKVDGSGLLYADQHGEVRAPLKHRGKSFEIGVGGFTILATGTISDDPIQTIVLDDASIILARAIREGAANNRKAADTNGDIRIVPYELAPTAVR